MPPDERVLTAIKVAEQATQAAKETAARAAGLTKVEYNVLLLLTSAPGITSAELARRSGVTAQAMNETVIRLERLGWVIRTSHPRHRHVRETTVTPSGGAAFDAADQVVDGLEGAIRAALSPDEVNQLCVLLARVTQVAGAHDLSPQLDAASGAPARSSARPDTDRHREGPAARRRQSP